MPGKLEKLEHTARQLLDAGLIDSLEEFDEAINAIAEHKYLHANADTDDQKRALKARILGAIDQLDKGGGTRFAGPEDAADKLARQAGIK